MEKKRQEKIDLAPVQAMLPKSRAIRYDNVKSAVAEEGVLALTLREPALLDHAQELSAADFSVPLFGRVFEQLRLRHIQGLDVRLGVLEELEPEEMSHIAGICQKQQGPVNEDAFKGCVSAVLSRHQSKTVSGDQDLLALRNRLKERKGAK